MKNKIKQGNFNKFIFQLSFVFSITIYLIIINILFDNI
jgi:hypothetical protein